MPWTTLVLVTVLFSVICGNRLMDNHLMRSASSSSSLIDPYKSDTNREDYLGIIPKFKENSKTFPHDLFYDKLQELPPPSSRRCNDKWLDFIKPEDSYVNCANDEDMNDLDKDSMDSNNDVDDALTVPSFKDLKFYGKNKNSRRIVNEVDEGRSMMAPPLSALPIANFDDFYDDLVVNTNKDMATMKRNGNAIGTALGTPPARGCDCRLKNDLVDLGQQHFPRYLLNAICQTDEMGPKCWSGSVCRPLEYKVKVLTFRTVMDNVQKDMALAWLPDDLRQIWKFKTVTVTAGCFCS